MASSTRRSATGAGRHGSDDIMALIDEHLAWQTESDTLERNRRGSAGTLIVDWDGTGIGHAYYRGRNASPAEVGHGKGSGSSSAATARGTYSTTSRAQPTYTASTISSSAKSKQPKPRRDSVVDSDVDVYRHLYNGIAHHLVPKAPTRCASTDVHFHRDTEAKAAEYGYANISVEYSPSRNIAHGHDTVTQLAYAYNGETMHVHERKRSQHQRHSRSGQGSHTPPLNAYFSVPVEKYIASSSTTASSSFSSPSSSSSSSSSGDRVKIAHLPQHNSLPPLPAHQKRTARSFVKRVLSRLNGSGVLGKMRQEREEMWRSEVWIGNGYVT